MTVEVETNAPKKGEQVQGYLTGQVKPDQSEEGQSPNAVTQILVDPWSLHSLTQKKYGGGAFCRTHAPTSRAAWAMPSSPMGRHAWDHASRTIGSVITCIPCILLGDHVRAALSKYCLGRPWPWPTVRPRSTVAPSLLDVPPCFSARRGGPELRARSSGACLGSGRVEVVGRGA